MLILNSFLLIKAHRRVVEGAHLGNLRGFVGEKIVKMIKDNNWQKLTCTIKFSYALNNSGLNITNDNQSLVQRKRYLKDELGNFYLLSVPDMVEYLNGKYQAGERIPSSQAQKSVNERWGILAYGNLHIDIWKRTKHNSTPYVYDLFAPKYASATAPTVYFWEINAPADPNL